MLFHKIQGAGGAAEKQIAYVGSVTMTRSNASTWSLNVLSVASPGDLVVIAFTFMDKADSTWSWTGMPFTAIYNETDETLVGTYVGYRFVGAGDTNPSPSGVGSGNWESLSVVASVFEGVTGYVNRAFTFASTPGAADPPNLTANGDLWITTAHFEDTLRRLDIAPSGYTLADEAYKTSPPGYSSTGIAYKIDTLSSDNPGVWGSNDGSINTENRTTTITFT